MRTILLLAVAGLLAGTPRQEAVDPQIRDAVLRFYATQEAEDLDGYLALWSTTAKRPPRAQLQFIFDSGDDKFSEITVTRVMTVGPRVRARVSAIRDRTATGAAAPDGRPTLYHTRIEASLTFVREGGALKLMSEGSPADDLAAALIDSANAEERRELLAAEPDVVSDALISALSRRAGDLARGGDYGGSKTIFERVLEAARQRGDRKAEGEALQNIGNALYFQQNFTEALSSYEQRVALERQQSNDEGLAAALLGVATIRYSFYEYSLALTSYREALAIQEKLDDRVGISTTLISTGNIAYLQGDYAAAAADYRRSYELARKTFNLGGAANALEGMGRALAAEGDFAAALQAYGGALEEGRARKDENRQGRATLSIAEIHFRLANVDTARKLFEESRGHFLILKDQANVGRAWQGTALTELVANRFAAAEEAYGKSAGACAAAADPECVAQATVGIAFAQWAQSNYEAAIGSYQKGIEAFSALKRTEEAARGEVGLSQAFLDKGDAAGALAAALRAKVTGTALGRDDVVWRARAAEARANRRRGREDDALSAALEAVGAVERMTRAALDNPMDVVPADAVDAYAILAVLQAGAGRPTAAFETLERRRTLALRVALARNERDIARGLTASEREEERRAAADLVSLRVQLAHERKLPKPDADRIARLDEAVAASVNTRAALQERLFAKVPELRVSRGLVSAIGADALADLLSDDRTVLAEFLIDNDDLLVVTARRSDGRIDVAAETTTIARRELAERVAAMLEAPVVRSVDQWRKSAGSLVALIPPAAYARMSAAGRLLLAPDDVLWRVPFEALPVASGWLGERTTVATIPSVTAVMRAPAAMPVGTEGGVVVVSAPGVPQSVRDRFSATAPGWTIRAPAAADAEARRVAAVYDAPGVTVLSAQDATELRVREVAPSATLLHIAAPFRVNSASPLFSPILLGGSSAESPAEPEDGVLAAHDVMDLQLTAGAVVLTDPAALSMRDAASALPVVHWAWRVAGVPVVIAPRWQQEDGPASEFLAQLHARLKAGDDAATALQGVASAMRARDDARAPYFWSGWILVGTKR